MRTRQIRSSAAPEATSVVRTYSKPAVQGRDGEAPKHYDHHLRHRAYPLRLRRRIATGRALKTALQGTAWRPRGSLAD
jgi:hypothetical protein